LTAYNNDKGVAESYYRKVRIGNAIQNPCVFSCVWPGDANKDLEANHYDIMTIGLNFGMEGPARDSVSNRWIGHFANNWSTYQLDGTNNKHGDCNGDGVINFEDTVAVSKNFAFSHYEQPGSKGNTWKVSFALEETTAKAVGKRKGKVQLGPLDKNTKSSIYAIGYEIEIIGDDSKINYNSIQIGYENSWFSAGKADNTIEFVKVDEEKSKIFFGLAKNDQSDITGDGEIAEIQFEVEEGFKDGDVAFSTTSMGGILSTGDTTSVGGGLDIELGDDIEICDGEVATLSLPAGLKTYSWSDGTTGKNNITVSESGTYTVTVTNSDGGTATDQVSVTVNDLPTVNLGDNATISVEDTIKLSPGTYSSYLWQDQSTDPTFQVIAGDYGIGTHDFWVQVTDENTCQASDTITITIEKSGTTGLNEGDDNLNVLVYPNPATDKLTIEFYNLTSKESLFNIISVDGSIVYNREIKNPYNKFKDHIDLSEFSRGVYLIRIISGEIIRTERLIIE